jgi:hypothetical protein
MAETVLLVTVGPAAMAGTTMSDDMLNTTNSTARTRFTHFLMNLLSLLS